jgi:hypothetical protein
MKNYLFLIIVSLCLFSIGCDYTGVPVEFASTCDKANDDKTVEVTGYFNNTGSSMCSKSGKSPMRCPIDFVSEPKGEKDIVRAELDLGSGGSSIENVEGEGLKIHDKDGGLVENTQKVKITANVNVLDTPRSDPKYQACWVVVKKVEKAQ